MYTVTCVDRINDVTTKNFRSVETLEPGEGFCRLKTTYLLTYLYPPFLTSVLYLTSALLQTKINQYENCYLHYQFTSRN